MKTLCLVQQRASATRTIANRAEEFFLSLFISSLQSGLRQAGNMGAVSREVFP